MAITRLGNNNYKGLSSDTKPTNIPDQSTFYETDTYAFYERISGAWAEKSVVDIDTKFMIYKVSSSLYKALNTQTGLVQFTSTTPDAAALTNSCIGVMSLGGKIKYSNDPLNFGAKVSVPSNSPGFQARPFVFEGQVGATYPTLGTIAQITSTFTDGDFLFETVAAGGSGETSNMHIKNINFINSLARGSNGLNVSGGATMLDAGFVNFESDTHGSAAGCPFSVENCSISYAKKGIRVAGWSWFGRLNNIGFSSPSNKFLGDYHIQFQNGAGHSTSGLVKAFDIKNIKTMMTVGLAAGGGDLGGSLNHSIVLNGGYHNVENVVIDNGTYNNDAFALNQCFSSVFNHIMSIDLDDTNSLGDATLVLDSVSPEGDAAVSTRATHNNRFINCVFQQLGTKKSIYFKNGAWRNEIQAVGYWGGAVTINDASAGIENLIEVITGHHATASAATKITSTNSLVKIKDRRVGAENTGFATGTGNGSTKVFTINHGCFATPVNYSVYPVTSDAMGATDVTVGSSLITITYDIAPPTTSSNQLKWGWYTNVY